MFHNFEGQLAPKHLPIPENELLSEKCSNYEKLLISKVLRSFESLDALWPSSTS